LLLNILQNIRVLFSIYYLLCFLIYAWFDEWNMKIVTFNYIILHCVTQKSLYITITVLNNILIFKLFFRDPKTMEPHENSESFIGIHPSYNYDLCQTNIHGDLRRANLEQFLHIRWEQLKRTSITLRSNKWYLHTIKVSARATCCLPEVQIKRQYRWRGDRYYGIMGIMELRPPCRWVRVGSAR